MYGSNTIDLTTYSSVDLRPGVLQCDPYMINCFMILFDFSIQNLTFAIQTHYLKQSKLKQSFNQTLFVIGIKHAIHKKYCFNYLYSTNQALSFSIHNGEKQIILQVQSSRFRECPNIISIYRQSDPQTQRPRQQSIKTRNNQSNLTKNRTKTSNLNARIH